MATIFTISRIIFMQTPTEQGKFHVKENVKIQVLNPDGSICKVWQPNEAGLAYYKEHGVYLQTPEHGSFEDEAVMSNLVTNVGKASFAKRFGGIGGTAAFTYIAIGVGTTAANVADTALVSEITTNGGQRVSVTPTSTTTTVTNDTIVLANTFTFTGSFALAEVGILNAASSGDLASRYVYSVINVTSGMQVAYTYSFAIS